jgi:predicted nucleic acid-binding protein
MAKGRAAGSTTHSVLLDINVVLDVLLERHPFVAQSRAIWKACDDGRLLGCIAATTPPTIFYVARKLQGLEKARTAVSVCLNAFEIVTIHQQILNAAMAMNGDDFEDNIQIACAAAEGIEFICTSDPAGFSASIIPAINPEELLTKL